MNSIISSKYITHEASIEFFSLVYSVPSNKIFILTDIEKLDSSRTGIWIIFQRIYGEFELVFEIYDEEASVFSDIELAKKFSKYFNCVCLISDDNSNPYTMIEIYQENERCVKLDHSLLDKGVYTIIP